jgi:hypothetical protein
MNLKLAWLWLGGCTTPRSISHQKPRTDRAAPVLHIEALERRQLMAVDLAETFDLVRKTAAFQKVEQQVVSAATNKTVHIDRLTGTTNHENQFLRKLDVRNGAVQADVIIEYNKSGFLTERFTVVETFAGRSSLDDIRLVDVSANVKLSGLYEVVINGGKVRKADWRSEGTSSVVVQSGPLKGVDYQINMLASDGREYGDKVTGLTTAELVATAVRNFTPVNTSLGDWISDKLGRLEKAQIPGIDFQKQLGSYQILIDSLAGPAGRSDSQIYADILADKSFIVGVSSSQDLLRFAEGGVTSIVGRKFKYSNEWESDTIPLTGKLGAVLFGGVVTVDVGLSGYVAAGVDLVGTLVADSRGYGLSEGSHASLSLKGVVEAVGYVAIVGFEKWSLLSSETRVGVFVKGSLVVTVGSRDAAFDVLVDGHTLYVTSVASQTGSFRSYLNADLTASAGATFKEKVTAAFGLIKWSTKKEKEWQVYTKEVLTQTKQLGT